VPGNSYNSDLYIGEDNQRYRVLTKVGPDVKVTAVVKSAIMAQVEEHQRKNLRLIPFPSESTLKLESVKPNSTIDTTVITGEDNGNASHYYENEVVVQFTSPLTEQQLQELKKEIECTSARKMNNTYIFTSASKSTEELIAYFRNNWPISFIEPHYIYLTNEQPSSAVIVPNDALYQRYQWNIKNIQAELGWNLSKGSEDVIIAILDSGVQLNHPDLQ